MRAEESIIVGPRRSQVPRGQEGTESPSGEALAGNPGCFTLLNCRTAVRGPYTDLLAKLNLLGWRTRPLRLSYRPEETKKAFHSRNLKSIVDTLIDAY
jgi:hypothetical protein